MTSRIVPSISLPPDAKTMIWRIFGNGESPLSQKATYDLIEPITRRRVCSSNQDQAIAEISTWFESSGSEKALNREMIVPVAGLIIEGIGDVLSSPDGIEDGDTAFWAVGSIDPRVAAPLIRTAWMQDEIDSFIHHMLNTLEILCKDKAVLDLNRVAPVGIANAKLSMNDVRGQTSLEAFLDLYDCDWWLYDGIGNVIELIVKLNPEHFYTLVERIDHPVILLRAARCTIGAPSLWDHRKHLQWITCGSSDGLVGLALVHVLKSLNKLDSDLRRAAESQHARDDLEATASGVIASLADRLALIEPAARARWIVELLNHGLTALDSYDRGEKTRRVEQLEKICTQLLVQLVCRSKSDELLAELRQGLCLDPLRPRSLPLAAVAWEIRDEQPGKARDIARLILGTYEQRITERMASNRTLFYTLGDWHDRDWIVGLGIALALSSKETDLQDWVSVRCHELPLSVWDAEEDVHEFGIAERFAQLHFLVALHAIPALSQKGRAVDPSAVRLLAEKLWAHCHFAGRFTGRQPANSEASEYAARIAIAFGEPSDVWVLEQARNPEVDAHTLWALIDQRMSRGARVLGPHAQHDTIVATEILCLASARFSDLRGFALSELHYLAKLWLLLDAADEAERTAMALVAFSEPLLTRHDKLLALKLLAIAANKRRPVPSMANQVALLYNELWRSYTPAVELEDRRQIDQLLN